MKVLKGFAIGAGEGLISMDGGICGELELLARSCLVDIKSRGPGADHIDCEGTLSAKWVELLRYYAECVAQ